MEVYEMDTFVASCRTVEGALEFARFVERKFPLDRKSALPETEQLHKFNVVVSADRKIEVHSTVPVNQIGCEDFKRFVAEFTTLKLRKPTQRAGASSAAIRQIA